ncbi:MAG TPA: universal stress protein [Bryobacteraceae bacterium]|nr:universal stress protein [Bryobacteraceae bacterium]
MTGFPRILFPVDFSERSAAVAPAVKAMAKRFGSDVVVLHVIDLPPAWYGTPEASAWSALINADQLRLQGRVALERFIAQNFAGTSVTAQLEEGDAARQIVDYASDHPGLIMIPTSGYGPFRALLLGSVTAKVLHDAPGPVWTGVHVEEVQAHPPQGWKRMLCALEGEPRDLSVLRWAADFAADQALELRLVHAVRGATGSIGEATEPGMYAMLFEIAREQIEKLQKEAGTRFEVCLLAGTPGRVVRQAATGHESDLVVIGRGVIQKPFGRLRSSAYSIIREAPCPVISV